MSHPYSPHQGGTQHSSAEHQGQPPGPPSPGYPGPNGQQPGSHGQPAGAYGQPVGQQHPPAGHGPSPAHHEHGGAPSGYPGAPGPGQPEKKRNWFARHKILTGVLAVIALFVVVGLFSGGNDDDVAPVAQDSPDTQDSSAQDAAAADTDADGQSAGAEEASAEADNGAADEDAANQEQADDEAAGTGQEGTRDNPYPAGTPVELGDYTITLGETTTDAWDQIEAENMFNDPPADGRQFVMVPVTASYDGDDTGWATMDLDIAFVGSEGNTFNFGSDDYCGVIPNSLSDQGEMYAGGTVEGNVCVAVAADQIDGGAWRIEEMFSFSDAYAFIDLS